MTKFLIALVALMIGWVGGRSLSIKEVSAVNIPPGSVADTPYHVPGEAVQTVQTQLDQANQRIKELEAGAAAKEAAAPVAGPLNSAQALAVKRAFEDIQGEVAAGKYDGLSLSEGYQTMNKILANPEIK